jgi:small-conductance mechanosensitive channel
MRLVLFLFLVAAFASAQNYKQSQSDSVNLKLISDQENHLNEIKASRRNDSLQRVSLEKQLANLKASENQKKLELQRQIAEMKSRDSLRIDRIKNRIDSLKRFIKGFPVVPFPHDTLFYLFNKVGSFTPQERAQAVGKRIKKLADDFIFHPDSMKLVATDQSIDITYNELILVSITETDALWLNTAAEKLAADYKTLIINSVIAYHKETSLKTILIKVGFALLIIAGLITLIVLITKIFRWTKSKIASMAGTMVKGIRIRDYELLNIQKQTQILVLFNSIVKGFMILLTVYFSLPLIFGLFPWTKNFATVLIGYFINPLKAMLAAVWNYMPNLFTIIMIVIVFRYVLRGIKYLKHEVERESLRIPGFYPDLANPTFQIIRVLIYAFMLVVIFPYLPGSNSPIFQGVSVFLGILFTFGSTGSLSNLIAGLVITFMRSFKVGDWVQIGEMSGDVIEKSMLVTRIRTPKNEIISIPNSTILNSHMINFTSDANDRGLIIHTTVTIGYDAPWRQIHGLLIDAALSTNLIEKEPAPFVLQTSLEDFYVSYQINAFTRQPSKQPLIYSMLHQSIQDKFNEAGVEIMSPHYNAHRDGNATAIPSDYLPKDYIAPSFRISEKGK